MIRPEPFYRKLMQTKLGLQRSGLHSLNIPSHQKLLLHAHLVRARRIIHPRYPSSKEAMQLLHQSLSSKLPPQDAHTLYTIADRNQPERISQYRNITIQAMINVMPIELSQR